MKLRVVKSVMRSERIKHFTFAPIEPLALPPFEPGAHVTIDLPVGDVVLSRQYSLMNYSPRDAPVKHMEIAVLLEPQGRGGSRRMHELGEGDIIDARGPANAFPLQDGLSECIFIAGGIGVTPLLSMARASTADGRAFCFHYFVTEPGIPTFAEELNDLSNSNTHVWAGLGIARAQDRLRKILSSAEDSAEFYVCGPNGMIDSVHEICADVGIGPSRVHFERFGAPAVIDNESAYTVRLSRSATELVVGADQTLLEALTAHGIVIHSSCGAGVCGSCLVEVVEGEIDHRDAFLLDTDREEGRLMCACVSRARGASLTLDL